MSVPCYGDCGPDPVWEAQEANKRAKEGAKKLDLAVRANAVLKRMLEQGVPPEQAARLQRIVDLEVENDRLHEERIAIETALKKLAVKVSGLTKLCERAVDGAREVSAQLNALEEKVGS